MEEEIQNNLEKKESPKIIEINVISKGKRILVFLADFFLNAILAFLLFNVLVAPICKAATGYSTKNETYVSEKKKNVDVFISNNILFSKYNPDQDERYSFSNNLSYTYDRWLSYYVVPEGKLPDEKDTNIKHDINNEVIRTFFINVRKYDNSKYLTSFEKYNETNKYFVKNGDLFVLPKLYADELYSHFDSKQGYTLTDKGNEYYNNIRENVFLKLYSEVMTDVNKNNLTYSLPGAAEYDYLASKKIIDSIENYHNQLITWSAVGTYILSWAIYYLILPLFFDKHPTVAMMIMKVDRIHFHNAVTFSKKMSMFSSIYSLFTNLAFLMFLPIFLITFNYLFNLTLLFSLSMMSFAFILGSLIFLLFSSFSQTLSDKLTRSVFLLTEDLENLYHVKGCEI